MTISNTSKFFKNDYAASRILQLSSQRLILISTVKHTTLANVSKLDSVLSD